LKHAGDELLEQEEIERHKLDRKIAAELDWCVTA